MILPLAQIHLLLDAERSLVLLPRGTPPRAPYAPGRRISLHRAFGAPAIGRVMVTAIDDVALGDLTDEDARLVGCRDLEDLAEAWTAAHQSWDEHARVWRIALRPDREKERRLLTPTARPRGSELGYTTSPGLAMRDAGEAVEVDTLAGFGRSAQRRELERFEQLLEQRRRLEPEERLRRVRADAARRRVDVSSPMRVIAKRLDAMERKTYAPVDRTTAS